MSRRGPWMNVRQRKRPRDWSIPILRFSGVTFRLHPLLVLWAAIRLTQAFVAPAEGDASPRGPYWIGIELGALLLVLMLHELGHTAVTRRLGGARPIAALWPLGGLDDGRPPAGWNGRLQAALGGMLVNIAIFCVLATVLGALTQSPLVAIPLPFQELPLDALTIESRQPAWLVVLFTIHEMNLLLLLANAIPAAPLDGGRILQTIAWGKTDWSRSCRIAIGTGFACAVTLVVIGIAIARFELVLLAGVCLVAEVRATRRLEWTEQILVRGRIESVTPDPPADAVPPAPPRRFGGRRPVRKQPSPSRPQTPEVAEERRDQSDAPIDSPVESPGDRSADLHDGSKVDQILARISDVGIEGLTESERESLRLATERRQTET